MSSYLSVTGTVTQIQPVSAGTGYGCSISVTVNSSQQGEVNFIVNGDTFVVDSIPLNLGDQVTIFYDGNAPTPLIYPPQYKALVVAFSSYYQYYLGEFNYNLVSTDGAIQLNNSEMMNAFLPNGQPYYGALTGNVVLVGYTRSTRSIPPIVYPDRITVFCYR